jgi:tape measure domain-containing protein
MAAEDISLRVGVENVDQIAAAIGAALKSAFQEPTKALSDIQQNLQQIADVGFSDVNKETKEASQAFQDLQKNIDGAGQKIGDLGNSVNDVGNNISEAINKISGVFDNLDSLFENIDQKIAAVLDRIKQLISAGQTAGSSLGSALGAAGNASAVFAGNLDTLNSEVSVLSSGSKEFVNAYKDFFPASVIQALNIQNEKLVNLQKVLNDETKSFSQTDLSKLRLEYKAIEREILTLRQTGVTAAVAKRDAENSASRERVAEARAESSERSRLIGQQVAEAQIAAKAESDAVRTSSQERIALTQSAAKAQVATFKFVAQAFQSTERLITKTFEITTNTVTAAFRGILRVAENTTNSLSLVFKRSGDKINNDFAQTMSSNENTLQNSVNQQSTIINNFAQSANRTLGSIGVGQAAGFLAGGALIGRALTGGFQRQALLEESERSLTILLGDAEKAVQLKERTLEVVRGTPFRLDQFADAAAQLVAFNVDAEKVPRFLQAIADSAAVKGGNAAQSIDTLVRVFGQVTTTARISLTDINSIAGAGVPALDILGNAFGKTADELRGLISQGAIPAQEALDALADGITNGTEGVNGSTAAFGGLAKELGNTTRGALANFDTAINRLGANIITEFRPAIIAFATFATTLVDSVGKVTTNIAKTIASSPLFKAILRFVSLTSDTLKTALNAAEGAIKSFSDGLLFASSVFASLFVARRIPALLSAIQFAIARLLTPVNLAFVALTALGAFFSRLLEQSPGLRAALSSIGDAFQSAFEPIGNLLSRIIPALQESLGALLTGGLGSLSTFVLRFLLPALQRLATFLNGTVVPAVRNLAANVKEFLQGAFATFVSFVSTTVVPVLVTAFGIVLSAIKRVVDFVQDTILPVVLPVLERFADVAVSAFNTVATFVTTRLVPAVQRGFKLIVEEVTNFVNVFPAALREFATAIRQAFNERSFKDAFTAFRNLLGSFSPIAAAAGLTVALAFINPFAALLVGVGVLAFASFGSDIVKTIQPQLQKVLDFVTGLFSGPNLKKVSVEFLKLVNRIGQILGNIVSDPRVVGIVAALAAIAAATAAAFITGFVQGLLKNVPALVAGLTRVVGLAFQEALKTLVRNPLILAGLIGLVAGAAALRAFKQAGTQASQAISQGLQTGSKTVGAGVIGQGASFWQGFVGNPSEIEAAIQPGIEAGRKILAREVQFNNRLIKQLTGKLPPIGTGLQEQQKIVRGLAATYGEAAVAGARFATGLQAVRQGLIFREFATFSQGVRAIGQSLKTQLPAIGRTAGTVLGGALGAAFSARLLLEGDSLGDKVAGGLGLAATGLGVAGSLGFTPVGIAAGGAAVGIGLLTSALQSNSKRAEEAERRIRSLQEVLLEFDDPKSGEAIASALEKTITNLDLDLKQKFLDAFGEGAVPALAQIFDSPDAVAQFSAGLESFRRDIAPSIGDGFRDLFTLSSSDVQKALSGLQELFDEFGLDLDVNDFVTISETGSITDFTGYDELAKIFSDLDDAFGNIEVDVALTTAPGAFENIPALIDEQAQQRFGGLQIIAATADVKAAIIDAFNVEKGNLEQNVSDAKSALDDARTAADQALQAVLQFFRGEELDLTEAADKAVLNVERIADSFDKAAEEGFAGFVDGIATGSQLGVSLANEAARALVSDVSSILGPGIAEGIVVDEQTARAALSPLVTTILQEGTDASKQVALDLAEQLATGDYDFSALIASLEGDLSEGSVDALRVIQQNVLDRFNEADFQATVDVLANLKEEEIPRLQALFAEAEIRLENFVISFTPDDVDEAARDIVGRLGVGIASPESQDALNRAAASIIEGINAGLDDDASIEQSGEAVIDKYVNVFERVLDSNSPSRLTAERIGKPFAQGIAKGIDDEVSNVASSARQVGQDLVNGTIAGIDQREGVLFNRIRRLIDGAVLAAESAARISSPSQEFRDRIGDPIVQGIILGITDNEFDLYDSLDDLIVGLIEQLDDSLLEFRSTGNKVADEIGFGIADGGADVLGSISGIINQVYNDSLSEAQLFKEVGQEIAAALFAGMSTGAGGFGSAFEGAGLQLAFFDVIDSSIRFGESLSGIREEFGSAANTFDISSQAGREAQRAFFAAGNDIRNYAESLIEAGRPLNSVIGETQAWRDSLIEAALANGATNDQITEMIARLRLSDTELAAFAQQVQATQEAAQQAAEEARRLREEERKQREAEEKARRAFQERERREREEERKREQAEREKERAAREKEREERERERELERQEREREREEREAERERERREREEEDRRRRETTLPPAAFENLIIQTPAGDPEAVALLIANRVAYSIRGT